MSDTNRPVQSQKQARSLKFRIYEEEGLYYPCSENKGTDQLRSYNKADLRLCFCLGKYGAAHIIQCILIAAKLKLSFFDVLDIGHFVNLYLGYI